MASQALYFERIIFLLCLITPLIRAQLSTDQYAAIRDVVLQVMERNHIPGLGLAIVSNGAVTTEGFGLRDVEKGLPVTDETLFSIASLSKAFTGVLVAKNFFENGRPIDAPINDMIPGFLVLSDRYRSENTMMKDLVAHRTGLDAGMIPMILDIYEDLDDLWNRLKYYGEVCQFRMCLEYNNYGYLAAGRILENLTGISWFQLVQEQIFNPLGMGNSTFASRIYQSIENINMAKPYYWNETHLESIDTNLLGRMNLTYPAGDIVSSAKDMAKWLSFILTKGLDPLGVPLVDQAVINMVTKAYILASNYKPTYLPQNDIDIDYGYAMGFYIGTRKGYRRFQHGGSFTNYFSDLRIYPDLNLGVFTTTSGPTQFNEQDIIHNFIMDTILEIPASSAPTKQPENKDTKVYIDDVRAITNPEQYIGTYGSWAWGNVTITYENEYLRYSFGKNGQGRLFPVINETLLFRIEVPQKLIFEMNYPLALTFHPNNGTDASPDDPFRYIHCVTSPNLWFERDLKLQDAPPKLWNGTDC